MGWEESVVIMEVMDEVRRQGGVKYPERIGFACEKEEDTHGVFWYIRHVIDEVYVDSVYAIIFTLADISQWAEVIQLPTLTRWLTCCISCLVAVLL